MRLEAWQGLESEGHEKEHRGLALRTVGATEGLIFFFLLPQFSNSI